MNRKFVHLHVHSDYSLMDGIQPASEIGTVVKNRDMEAVALTDHGYMGGIRKFVKGCKEAKVKPIIGNETYLAYGSAKELSDYSLGTEEVLIGGAPNKPLNNGHFLLLCKNKIGYRNLLKLTEYSYEEGFYKNPRIDFEKFLEHSEGLIATSTCLGSQMADFYRRNMKKEARKWIDTVIEAVGRENFFFEVQVNNIPMQRSYNDDWIIPFAKEYDIPLVLTADAHQANQEDWELRGLIQCLGWSMLPHKSKYPIQDCNAWMYDTEFALKLCKDWNIPEEAVFNTAYVADKVEDFFDDIEIKDSKTDLEKLKESKKVESLAKEGIVKLLNLESWEKVPLEYKERLQTELNLIQDCNYSNYFLNVRDYIQIAKSQDIPVGPGRGSSAGSILAWALGITSPRLDPIKYGLFFERFLNPGRVSISIGIEDEIKAALQKEDECS